MKRWGKAPSWKRLPIFYNFRLLPKPNSFICSEQEKSWLLNINSDRRIHRKREISTVFLEYALKIIEETSTFKIERSTPMEVQCTICGQFDGDETNDIILCDLCNDGVHIYCYGVAEIPEDQWLCRKCQLSPTLPVKCALCPYQGGAFKTTLNRIHPWMHVTCGWLHPKASFANVTCKEPAVFNWKLLSNAKNPVCVICKVKEGHCIKCAQKHCRKGVFHASCALSSEDFTVVDEKLYCTQHARQLESEEQTNGDRNAFVRRPPIFPSVTEEAIEKIRSKGIQLGILSENDKFLEQLKDYWLLLRVYNSGVPLIKRTPLTIDANEQTSREGDSFETEVQSDEEIRHVLEDLKTEMVEIKESPNPLEDLMKDFKSTVQPRSKVQFMEYLLDLLGSEDCNNFFADPVDPNEVKDYYKHIKCPMDLSTMRQNVWKYFSVEDLERDFLLMMKNCLRFNATHTVYYKEAQRLMLWSVNFFQSAKLAFHQV